MLAITPFRLKSLGVKEDSKVNSFGRFKKLKILQGLFHIIVVKERAQSELRAHSSSIRSNGDMKGDQVYLLPNDVQLQSFIKEDVLVSIINEEFPCTAEKFLKLLLSDDSKFIAEYRKQRKDTNLKIGQWHVAKEYSGHFRELNFRSVCHSPMCPPDTAVTEWQHVVLSSNKTNLVFESAQQPHDVPFGSFFEVHSRWVLETQSDSCRVDIRVGAHFKKWCIMQSKIKSSAVLEYKKEADLMLEVAREYIQSSTSSPCGIENSSDDQPDN